MNCERAAELIDRRFDGELDQAERARLDEHLAGCSNCRQLAERMDLLAAGFVALRAENQAMWDRHASARSALGRLRRALPWAVPAALATAACLVLMFRASSHVGQPSGVPIVESGYTGSLAPDVPAAPIRRPVVTLVGESRDKYLAAEVESGVPNVRLVFVVPVATKTRDPAPEPSSSTQPKAL